MDLKLKGRTALITGASKGVGRAIALTLAEEGAHVVVNYSRDRQAALEVVDQVKSLGSRAIAIPADISFQTQCVTLFESAQDEFGEIDILVNNAGVWPTHWIQDIPILEWNNVMDTNLTAVFLLSQLFIRSKIEKKSGGKILNITSQAAFHGATSGHAHYAASKAGVVAFTVSAAREFAKYGINVNAIALGIVETELLREALATNRAEYEKRIPLGRVSTPEDISKIAVFLVSSGADYITGATIDATGGMLMR